MGIQTVAVYSEADARSVSSEILIKLEEILENLGWLSLKNGHSQQGWENISGKTHYSSSRFCLLFPFVLLSCSGLIFDLVLLSYY